MVHDEGVALKAARRVVRLLRRRLLNVPFADARIFAPLRATAANASRAARLLLGQLRHRPPDSYDLGALIHQAAAQAPPERASDVAVRLVGNGPLMGSRDAVAVSAILVNLLESAARYSPPGTPIIVATTSGSDGVEIVVGDEGGSVPDVELGTMLAGDGAAASGRGLGLRASHRLADEMGGCLWATDEPSGGSAFHLWLPAPQPPTARRLVEKVRSRPTTAVSAALSAERLPRTGLKADTSSWRQQDSLPRRDLSGRNLSAVNFSGDDLHEDDLHDATLSRAFLKGARLDDANLERADLSHCDLIRANPKTARLAGSDLTAAKLVGCDVTAADFRGARLAEARLDGADFTWADLGGTDLRGAALDETNTAAARSLAEAPLDDATSPSEADPNSREDGSDR